MPDNTNQQNAREDYLHRLINPRFELIEKHFSCKVPQSLRDLYANREEIVKTDIYIAVEDNSGKESELYVESYDPLDENVLVPFPDRENYINFASCGEPFVYMIDPSIEDPEVCLYSVEGTSDDLQPLGITLSQFVSAPRRYA